MPQGDKTGPDGQGPMTGRAMGFCAGANSPGFSNIGFGRGFGRSRKFAWRARTFQNIPQPQITEAQEKQILKQELEAVKSEQAEIQARLKELK